MGWRIFKSTDSGAPTGALNVSGSLAAILRACLIDGYGTIDPVGGWSEPFTEANNVSVFRADAGNRQFYKFTDTAGPVAEIKAYESMSDLTTGTGAWPSSTYYIGKYYTTATLGWVVVANEYTVIFIGVAQYGWLPQMFGEFDSIMASAPYNNMIIGTYSTSLRETYSCFSDFSATSSVSSTGKRVVLHRLPDGTGLGFCTGITGQGACLGGPSSYAQVVSMGVAETIRPVLSPMLFYGTPDSTTVPSGNDYYLKMLAWGIIPMILTMSSPVIDFTTAINATAEWTDTDTGLSYLLFPYGFQSYTALPRVAFAIPLADLS